MASRPIRVMIVDDHDVVRAGLAAILTRDSSMVVVAEAGNGREAIARFRECRPDVTVLDLSMPGLEGQATLRAIRAEFPDSRFVIFTVHAGDEDIHQALRAGAQAYLLKTATGVEVVETVRAVHEGLRHLSREAELRLSEYPITAGLTPREFDVLRLLARGHTNREIAAELGVTETTAKWFVKNILEKLGATDRTAAVTTALERGILHSP
jgi:two-component system, NarL family, response regulator